MAMSTSDTASGSGSRAKVAGPANRGVIDASTGPVGPGWWTAPESLMAVLSSADRIHLHLDQPVRVYQAADLDERRGRGAFPQVAGCDLAFGGEVGVHVRGEGVDVDHVVPAASDRRQCDGHLLVARTDLPGHVADRDV